MVAPVFQLVSIGTQITEAFAGLDRMHEVLEEQPGKQRGAVARPLHTAEATPPLLQDGEHPRVVGLDRAPDDQISACGRRARVHRPSRP